MSPDDESDGDVEPMASVTEFIDRARNIAASIDDLILDLKELIADREFPQ